MGFYTMVLHKILTDELLNRELLAIGRDEISEINKYVVNLLSWCSNYNAEICKEFVKHLEEFIKSIVKLRLMKYVVYGSKREGSLDTSLVDELLTIFIEYYKFLIYGLLDSNGNVVAEVIKDFEYGDMKYRQKSVISIPLKDALLLSRVGYVKLLDKLTLSPRF